MINVRDKLKCVVANKLPNKVTKKMTNTSTCSTTPQMRKKERNELLNKIRIVLTPAVAIWILRDITFDAVDNRAGDARLMFAVAQ